MLKQALGVCRGLALCLMGWLLSGYGISPNLLTIGMRNDKLPIGFAVRQEDRYRENWTYAIIPERLIAYKHGKINEVQVQGIEHNLETIIKEFTEMKKDLSFLLRGEEL